MIKGIGDKIKYFRIKSDLAVEDLAKEINISYKTVYDWEENFSVPCYDNAIKLCEIFNINIDELIDGNLKLKYIYTFLRNLDKENLSSLIGNKRKSNSIWSNLYKKDRPYIEGKKAIDEFIKKENNDVYIFFDDSEDILEKRNLSYEELVNIIKNDYYEDCYVVNKNFTWSFIITHETMYLNDRDEINLEGDNFYIGPFFIGR